MLGFSKLIEPRNTKSDFQNLLLRLTRRHADALTWRVFTALEDENPEVFLLALRDVVEANSTMSELAKATNLNRESLYKTLSEKGNPQLNSVRSILNQIRFKLAVEVN
jgi:probable addiction module antidote protein